MATVPSIAMIPSGYKAAKLYSVLPSNGDGDMVAARASTKTRVNEDRLIEDVDTAVPSLDYSDGGCPVLLVEPQSTNLITYPVSFGNSYWTKSGASVEGDPSTAGTELVVNGDMEGAYVGGLAPSWLSIGTPNAFESADAYIGSKAQGINILSNGANDYLYQSVTTVVNQLYLVTFWYKRSSGTGSLSRSISGTGGVYDKALTTTTTYQEGTFYFTASSTSHFIKFFGDDNSTPLIIDNVSVKEVQGFNSPHADYPTSAFKLVASSANGFIQKITTGTSGVDYSNSFYMKRVTGTGNVLLKNADNVESVVTLKTSWQKFNNTDESSSTSIYTGVKLATSGDEILIAFSQLEQQSSATSFIYDGTEGSTTTRLKDEVSKTGISSLINSIEGVLYAEVSTLNDGSSKSRRIFLKNAGNSLQVVIQLNASNNEIKSYVFNTAFQCELTTTDYNVYEFNKIAFIYSVNYFALYVNGLKISEDTSGITFSSNDLTELNISVNTVEFEGKVKDLRVYKTALTDAELTSLTTL